MEGTHPSWYNPSYCVAAAAAATLGISWVALYPYQRWRVRHIPGPIGLPFIGTLDRMVKHDVTHFVTDCAKKYGPIFKIWFAMRPWIVVADVEVARKLMSRLLARPSLKFMALPPPEVAHVMNQGLLQIKGAPWRVARKAFESALMHRGALGMHMEVMEECVGRLLDRLQRKSEASPGGILNIAPLMGDLTMDIVGCCVFGTNFNTQGADSQSSFPLLPGGVPFPHTGEELVVACKAIFTQFQVDKASKWVPLASMFPNAHDLLTRLANWLPDRSHREYVHARKVVDGTSLLLVQMYRRAREEGIAYPGFNDKSFIGQLVNGQDMTTGDKLDESQIVGQAVTFLLAGYETTASTLAFTSYLLAAHPECQARVLKEVDAGKAVLLQKSSSPQLKSPASAPAKGPITVEANGSVVHGSAAKAADAEVAQDSKVCKGLSAEELAAHFPYTCAVIDEALRLYPPGASAIRSPPEDIEVLGKKIPADSFLYFPLWTFQRDANIWPEADKFMPERFLPEGQHLQPPEAAKAYAPFGHGARSCPGYRFALQEARLAVVRMFSRFTLELGPMQESPIRVSTGITVAPTHGVWVAVKERGV